MQCHHFDAGRCHSCTLLEIAYPTQVLDKERHVAALLAPFAGTLTWLPPVTGAESAFRNKAKMVVSGTVDEPVLGILDREGPTGGHGIDLTDCGLYPPALQAAFPALAAFVTRARLEPYTVAEPPAAMSPVASAEPGRRAAKAARAAKRGAHRGELKYLLVTLSPDGELMVRFVLRSQEPVARMRKHLPWLQAELPQLAVVTANIQPAHAAVLEGDLEIPLSERTALPMRLDGITLNLRPQSFFQTNTEVAAALYRQAREWVDAVDPASLWDLYCGVGGFALHCAAPGRSVTGVEISAEAIAAAWESRDALVASSPEGAARFGGVRFAAGDATAVGAPALAGHDPDMVIVNPPRRGIGADLSRRLEHATGVRHVLYSSCNATTLAKDLAAMPSFVPRQARVLDMFPQTSHYEVLVLLERA
ncbi:23S rRNA (uracil(747)-C(5))-methyltransferase RlmC [Antribacter sp. KLBMP9083]|uniref:23S rRNA (Uracil(747)-C(5))-methyltransferase RlmC n=1 Tax=Antribacter soli TaxID=2910976 RepID=A0AA41QCB1_9MICO|nr:23S rRNA (uracil(747)-C(5))-methyltransferase RlmC [Antribacter soli]MCF4120517.1 23S rRNA (uracil(747)-C(5))-methyltransferase RlmC [Antribacter soli]